MKNRLSQAKKQTIKDDHIMHPIKIHKQYANILQKVAHNEFLLKQSPETYLLNTLFHVREIKRNMREQMSAYNKIQCAQLQSFIEQRQLFNSGNLIAQYHNLNDEIKHLHQQINAIQQRQPNQDYLMHLSQEQHQLESQLKKAVNRRIQLQNRGQMIKYQMQAGEEKLVQVRVKYLQQQLRLRSIEEKKTRLIIET